MSSRPHLPFHGKVTGPNFQDPASPPSLVAGTRGAKALAGRGAGQAAKPKDVAALAALPALKLDPLTAVDNPGYYDALALETNLPADVMAGLLAQRPA